MFQFPARSLEFVVRGQITLRNALSSKRSKLVYDNYLMGCIKLLKRSSNAPSDIAPIQTLVKI